MGGAGSVCELGVEVERRVRSLEESQEILTTCRRRVLAPDK